MPSSKPILSNVGLAAVASTNTMVVLDNHTVSPAAATYTFTPSTPLSPATYSEIIMIVNGRATASLKLQLRIDGSVAGVYYSNGTRSATGAVNTAISSSADTSFPLLTTTAITGASVFAVKIWLQMNVAGTDEILGHSESASTGSEVSEDNGLYFATGASVITSLTIDTSVSTMQAGTVIITYGRLRVA